MGFFSKTCAVSNLPVMSSYAGIPELSDVVALLPNGMVLKGAYDGYGRVDGVSLNEDESGLDFDTAKFVLARFYKPEMTYASLPKSHSDPGQGWFHDDHKLRQWLTKGGFPSFQAYRRAYEAC